MADQINKLTLTAEDKTSSAFRSVARNMQQLQGSVDQAGRKITSAAAGMATSFDFMGFSLGKVLAAGAVEEFARRSTTRWAEVERATTRATLALGSNQKEQRAILGQLRTLQKTSGVDINDLIAGFSKLATNSTLSVDKIIERLTLLADAAKVANLSTAEVAAGLLQAQHQFKFKDSEIQQFLDAMARKPAGMSAMIAALPKLSLVWSQIEGEGVKSALNMVDALNVLKKDFGGTEEAAGGLMQMLMRIESEDTSEKLRKYGFGNLKDTLIQAKKEGKSVLLTFTEIVDKIVEQKGERVLTDIFGPKTQFNARAFHDLQQRITKEYEKSKNAAGSVARGVKSLNENQQEAVERLKQSFDDLQIAFGVFVEGTKSVELLTRVFHAFGSEIEFVREGFEAINKFFRNPESLLKQHREELEGIQQGQHPLTKEQMDRARGLRGAIRTIEDYAPKLQPQVDQATELERQRDRLRKGLDAPAGPGVSPFVREEARKRGEDEIRALDEQIKALKENTEQLRQNDPKKMGFTPSGGGGGPRFVPGFRGGGMWIPGGGAEPTAFTPPGGSAGGPSPWGPPSSAGGGSSPVPPASTGGSPSGGRIGALPSLGAGAGAPTAAPGGVGGGGAAGAPSGAGVATRGDPRGMIPHIRATAEKYGIDPDVAVRVARSEGLLNPVGDRGMSHGAFQLYKGGGLGNEFQKSTGLDAADPANEKATIDYALKNASTKGWGAFHGAKRVGIGRWQGIGGRPQVGEVGQPPSGATSPGAVSAVGGKDPEAFIFHHTGGRGDVAGVQNTLRQRGLGVQYVMDREGNIVQTGGPGSSHMMRGSGAGAGLSNRNTVGMEVIAKNDKDVTQAQVAAAQEFARRNYPNTRVFGHGEVNPGHKEATEGKSIVDAIRTERGRGAAPSPAPMAGRAPVGMEQYQQMREELERPIKMNIETPDVPNQLTPQFRRNSGRNAMNRDFRDRRNESYADLGGA